MTDITWHQWAARAATYHVLHREARNLGVPMGDGCQAVAEAATAISRLRKFPTGPPLSERALSDLRMLFDRVDASIANIFKQAVHERRYFVRAKVPRIVSNDGMLAHRARQRFMPITSPIQTELVWIVRDNLRPLAPTARSAAADTREPLKLTEAIHHRPPHATRQALADWKSEVRGLDSGPSGTIRLRAALRSSK